MSMDTTIYNDNSVLALLKILDDCYCDYMIPRWGKNDVPLIYMDTDNTVVLTGEFYENVEDDVEDRYGKSNYDERKRKEQLSAGKKTN